MTPCSEWNCEREADHHGPCRRGMQRWFGTASPRHAEGCEGCDADLVADAIPRAVHHLTLMRAHEAAVLKLLRSDVAAARGELVWHAGRIRGDVLRAFLALLTWWKGLTWWRGR